MLVAALAANMVDVRITRVTIDKWRNIEGVDLIVPAEASVVCLVGENGTGKSHVLELLSAASQRLGLAPGLDLSRGDPFQEPHSLAIEGFVAEDHSQFFGEREVPHLAQWDGRIRLESQWVNGSASTSVSTPAVPEAGVAIANAVSATYQSRPEIAHVYLDADRAYPPQAVAVHEWANAVSQPYGRPDWERQWSYRATRTLYGEWLKYMLSVEQQVSTSHTQSIRAARVAGTDEPQFVDPFVSYASSLREVLPHLHFAGVDPTAREVTFDTAGVALKFSSLSGGEKEIAFLVGQLERFGLRRGLLLIDEPELHLNPDLLRLWLQFLSQTISTGQLWIATHSLEAVEVAGAEATFVAERAPGDRTVRSIAPVADRPLLQVLSRAIGSPAFSLHELTFVLIEGDGGSRERTRFHEIFGDARLRFLESGGGREVLRRLDLIRGMGSEADYPLRVLAILDRDFKTAEETARLTSDGSVHVLGCHEVENLFLQPEALRAVADQSGAAVDVQTAIVDCADRFAGMWVLQYAAVHGEFSLGGELRRLAGSHSWEGIVDDRQAFIRQAAQSGAEEQFVVTALDAYAEERNSPTLWKSCLGKQVAGVIPARIGLAGQSFLEQAVGRLWRDSVVPRPAELDQLLDFVLADETAV